MLVTIFFAHMAWNYKRKEAVEEGERERRRGGGMEERQKERRKIENIT